MKIQCPKEGCNGDEAAFFQVQIRSADEPMTGFYKVSWRQNCRMQWLNVYVVYDLWESLERKLIYREGESADIARWMEEEFCFCLLAIQRGVKEASGQSIGKNTTYGRNKQSL
jgi:hypothetical protein